jgi:crotonobetainyl-CoA:carnitine CoA-transferase CaiB-like acyl-CoA transferase
MPWEMRMLCSKSWNDLWMEFVLRIVEYGLFHAGPGANAILGDLGAEVIKIETASGDPERYWTNVAGFDLSLKNNESIIFEASNRNKK